MCSEPELGPGLMEWIALLGNARLWRICIQGSLPFHWLMWLTQLLSSLLSQPRSPTRKALAFTASCQLAEGVSGQALSSRESARSVSGIGEHVPLAFLLSPSVLIPVLMLSCPGLLLLSACFCNLTGAIEKRPEKTTSQGMTCPR